MTMARISNTLHVPTVPARVLSYPSGNLRDVTVSTLAVVLLCLLVGAALGWLAARLRAAADIARLEATVQARREGEERLEQSLRALSYEATAQSQEAVARAVAPLHETLRRYEQRVAELERDRVDAYAELREQVRSMGAVSGELRTETKQLVAALRAPQVRGRWGEHQLRRIVEAAGLLEHCDFAEQVTATNRRPRRPPRPGGHAARRPHRGGGRQGAVRGVPGGDGGARRAHAGTPTSTSTPSTCDGTSTSWRPRRTGRRSSRRPTSWCCSCRPTRSWTPRCNATRR